MKVVHISTSAVEDIVLRPSVVVEEYPGDQPFPSRLLLGWPQDKALSRVHRHDALGACRQRAFQKAVVGSGGVLGA